MNKFLLAFVLIHSSCSGEEHDDHHDDHHAEHGEEGGTPSGAECDPTVTYENFGMSFMTTYCTSCHSSTLTGPARNGAPDGHDFDTLEGILVMTEHIDEYAAAGPDASNEQMPPSSPTPTAAEREMLGAWLACEAP